MRSGALGIAGIVFMALPLPASGQWLPPTRPPPTPSPAPQGEADAPPPLSPDADHPVRFRGGIGTSMGGMFLAETRLFVMHFEARLGAQLSDVVGVWAQPSIGLHSGQVRTTEGTAMRVRGGLGTDFTIADRGLVGMGIGGGFLGGEAAADVLFRLGGYPWTWEPEDVEARIDGRRLGVLLAADLRVIMLQEHVLASGLATVAFEAF